MKKIIKKHKYASCGNPFDCPQCLKMPIKKQIKPYTEMNDKLDYKVLQKLRQELFKKRDEVVSKQYRQAIEWTIKRIDELVEELE